MWQLLRAAHDAITLRKSFRLTGPKEMNVRFSSHASNTESRRPCFPGSVVNPVWIVTAQKSEQAFSPRS